MADLTTLKRSFLSLNYEEAKSLILDCRASRRMRVVKKEKVKKITPAKAKKAKAKKQDIFDSLPADVKLKMLAAMLEKK